MRTVLFLFLFIFSVSTASAQRQKIKSNPKLVKVETLSFPIVPVTSSNLLLDNTDAVVGIFVMKNSRVKRALSFKVKTRNPKLA